jgi:hypothetical protein
MTILRLHVTAEGQTEQSFVKRILAPHLAGLTCLSMRVQF